MAYRTDPSQTDEERKKRKAHKRAMRRKERLYSGDANAPRFLREMRAWRRAAILRVGKEIRPVIDGILRRYSLVEDAGFPDPANLSWVPELEARTDVIRRELDAVLVDPARLPELTRISPDHDRIANPKWKAFFLYGYGHRSELGCRLCPETARAVEKIPDLESAFFSILLPGMHIRKHKGPTKSLLVCHLGVKIPAEPEKCRIRVDREIRPWQYGRVTVIDDTFQHEAWNETDEIRVVLLIHVRRPLRFPGSLVGKLIFNAIRLSPFVRDGRRNLADWEATFRLPPEATREFPVPASPAP